MGDVIQFRARVVLPPVASIPLMWQLYADYTAINLAIMTSFASAWIELITTKK